MSHNEHDQKCGICQREFWCHGGSCNETCLDCRKAMDALQPSARLLIEILLDRVSKLENGKQDS